MNETEIAQALGTTEPRVDTDDALARFRERVETEGIAPVAPVVRQRVSSRWLQGLAAAAGVVIVASALTLSGVADSVLKIFEPKNVVAVPVTQGDLTYLGQACAGLAPQQCLGGYGTFEWTSPPQPKEVQSRGQASAEAGFAALAPASLPSSVTGNPRYGVINRSSATFTFSADTTRQTAARHVPTHHVKVQDGSRLAGILGALEVDVNSFHHQAIKRLGRGLAEVAWAPDSIIEGVELGDGTRFVVGVQWHPEELVAADPAARSLFAALVDRARARSRE